MLSDLRDQLKSIKDVRVDKGKRHSRIHFRYEQSPSKLTNLRSVENVFAFIRRFKGRPLEQIEKLVSTKDFTPYQQLYDALHGSEAVPSFIFEVHGAELKIPRLQKILADRYGWLYSPRMKFHIDVFSEEILVGMQISESRMWKRNYKQVNLPAALEGTVAYLLRRMSRPRENDLVLDMTCGTGTILIESLIAGLPYRRLLGGDINMDSLRGAVANLKAADPEVEVEIHEMLNATTEESVNPYNGDKKRIQLYHWDARNLPLDDESVTTVISNFPYGKDAEIQGPPERLLFAFLDEGLRVLVPGGRMVFLTHHSDIVDAWLEMLEEPLKLAKKKSIRLHGLKPTVYTIIKNELDEDEEEDEME